MKKDDLITIVMPVYNSSRYLEDAIECTLKQTYNNIELIIINDSSTDNSEDIILRYVKEHSNIKYIKNDINIGPGPSRNIGIDNALGKYIYFLDSDDYIEGDFIEKLYNTIKEDDTFSCLTKGYKCVDGVRSPFNGNKEILELFQSPSVCIRLFNKRIIDDSNIRFSSLRVGEDLEFVFKLFLYNPKASYLDEALYTYNIHSDSTINSKDNKKQLDVITALQNILEYSKYIGKYNEFKDRIEYAFVSHILVGTIKRIKDNPNYNEEDIESCYNIVEELFPNWMDNIYVNKYLKNKISINSSKKI